MHRMTLDQCFPQFLLKKKPGDGSYPIIILGFMTLLPLQFYIFTGGQFCSRSPGYIPFPFSGFAFFACRHSSAAGSTDGN